MAARPRQHAGTTMEAATTTGRAAAAVLMLLATAGPARALDYPVVDTGQTRCYNTLSEIACPSSTAVSFYGQDAQHSGNLPSYTLGASGMTVVDNVTGLTWERSPDTDGDGVLTKADKLDHAGALAHCAAHASAGYEGYGDWRLPSIKELYSLINFNGTDPSGYSGTDTSGLTPFIDTSYFQFAYGQTSAGERLIDSQYASSTVYVASDPGTTKLFGVNFADGRIKGYDTTMPDGSEKTFFVQCVRGNPAYGINDFVYNGDHTVTDRATGLMWSKADSGGTVSWQAALTWVRDRNLAVYRGYDDWRLPDAKELQSLVDYSRSPATTVSPALDPLFFATGIINENDEIDWPWYWTSTTHAAYDGSGASGVYLAFGRAGGWMKATPSDTCYTFYDVHGAGAQRSDPKAGTGLVTIGMTCSGRIGYGFGPQGDVQRVGNYVRMVRTASAACGNGVIDIGEQCDGASLGSCSNGCAGNCTCLLCAATPQPPEQCFLQMDPAKASVSVADKPDNAGDTFSWKWNDGAATTAADLGTATASDATYAICIYDGSNAAQPLRSLFVQGDGLCNGTACWKATSTGYKYRNSKGNDDGVMSLLLKAGADGKSRVQVKARGSSLLPPSLALTLPVTVQLVVADSAGMRCWQTAFTSASANDSARFKAKGP